jgi:hypothetical protein
LAYQPVVRGSYDGRTTGMCGEATMAELSEGVGEAAVAETIMHKRGFWWGAMLTLAMKPLWVHYKLDETIEKPYSDFLTHTSEVCKGIPSIQWVSSYK